MATWSIARRISRDLATTMPGAGLETLLQSPRVIYCRVFVSETGAQAQDATCYGYYNYPGSLDTVDMFEEQLVSVGSHRITKRPDGSPARADLKEAEDDRSRRIWHVGRPEARRTMKACMGFLGRGHLERPEHVRHRSILGDRFAVQRDLGP